MNILLTNDDGYEAIGIQELHKSLGVNNQVFLIAPKDNCSGMSAAISLRKEIEVQEIDREYLCCFWNSSRLFISWIAFYYI